MTVEVRYIHSLTEYRRVIRHLRNQSNSIYAAFRNEYASVARRQRVEAAPPKMVTRRATSLGDKNTPVKNARPLSMGPQVSKISRLVADLADKIEVANHIYELLQHHYQRDNALVQKITGLVAELTNDLHEKFQKMLASLSQQAEQHVPADFRAIVDGIGNELVSKFQSRADSISIHYSMSATIHEETKQPILFFIGYVLFDNLETDKTTHDYCVVMTRKQVPGKADADYVRTLNEYKSPYWVATHDLGIEFDSGKQAYNAILVSLQAEKMLDVVDPIAIPVSKSDVKFDNPDIYSTFLSSKEGIVRLILRPKLTEQQAKEILKDSFAQLKNIVRRAHPRNKDTVSARGPYQMDYDFKLKNGSTKTHKTWAIDFRFAAPDDPSKTIPLTRDKIAEMVRIFDLQPDQQQDFVKQFKRYFGAK